MLKFEGGWEEYGGVISIDDGPNRLVIPNTWGTSTASETRH